MFDLLKVLLVLVNGYSDITEEEEMAYIEVIKDPSLLEDNDVKHKPLQSINNQYIHGIGERYRLRSRYLENKEENILLMEAKQIICEIFEIVFQLRNEIRIT